MPYKNPEDAKRWGQQYRAARRAEAKEASRLWRLENPEKSRQSVRTWQEQNPEKVRGYGRKWKQANLEHHNEYNREWARKNRATHPTWRRDQHLRLTFGITQVQWDTLFMSQEWGCAACGNKTAGRTSVGKDACWHTDHNPAYKKGHPKFIRGILCHWCNIAAHKRQTPKTLRALANYLEKNQ